MKDMPKPPPGWKPGDPITLPPGLLPRAKPEEPKSSVPEPHISRPVASIGPQPIEVMVVPFVPLDFESSDVGSSEDDED